jgi:WD40 repeat protein
VTVLDVRTGRRQTVTLEKPPHLAAVNFLRVAPNGRTWFFTGARIDAGNHNQVAATWAVGARTRRLLWTAYGPAGAIASPIQVSPDNRLVGVGYSSGKSDVLDASKGALVVREASSFSIAAGDLAFPPGDQTLVTVSLDGVFRTWATRGSEELRLHAPTDPAIDFTQDGMDLVLVGNHGEIVNRSSGRVVLRFPGFPAASVFNVCNSACFSTSPSLRWLTYLDPTSNAPKIIEIDGLTGRRVAAVTVPRLDAQAVAPDGRVAVAYVDGSRLYANLIDPRTGHTSVLPSGPSSAGCAATAPAFTPDGLLMAIGDGCVHVDVWNLRTGRVVHTVMLPDRPNGSGALLSPRGRYVLIDVLGGAFVRADLASGKVVEVPGAAAEGSALAISPDGRFYAIGRQDGTVDVYDARSLRLVRHHVLTHAIEALSFSPDSRELAVEDTSAVVWVWDTCSICENATALARLARIETVRQLTPGERATFEVP